MRHKKTAAGVVIGLAAAGLLYTGWVRARFDRLQRLHDTQVGPVCARFPREYVVGTGRPLRCVVMGDSTAVGDGASRLETSFPYLAVEALASQGVAVHVRNVAVVGACLADVVKLQLPLVTEADAVLISIGANDATHRTPFDTYAASLDALSRGLPKAEIYWATAPDMAVVPALPWPINVYVNSRIAEENARMRRTVAGAHVVDLFRDGKLDGAEDYAADDFHPNDKGYAIWGGLFRDAILAH